MKINQNIKDMRGVPLNSYALSADALKFYTSLLKKSPNVRIVIFE